MENVDKEIYSIKAFVIEYFGKKPFVSVVDIDFRTAVTNIFPNLKRIEKYWSVQLLPVVMKALNEMYKKNNVNKRIIGLSGANW